MLQNSLLGIAQNVKFYGKTAYNKRFNTDAATRGVTSFDGAFLQRGSAG